MFLEKNSLWISTLVCFLLLSLANLAPADEVEIRAFKKTYSENLKELKKRFSNVQIRMLHKRTDHVTKCTYLILGDRFQSRTNYHTKSPLTGSPYLRVRSMAGNTIFDIQQNNPGDSYSLPIDCIAAANNEQKLFNGPSPGELIQRRARKWSKPYALAAYHIFGASLEDVIKAQSTVIVSVSKEMDRAGVLKVVLKTDPEKFVFHHLELSLLPGENMTLLEYQMHASFNLGANSRTENLVYHVTMQYDSPIAIPVPNRVVVKSTSIINEVSSVHIEHAERIDLQVGIVKPEDFTRKNFGLRTIPDQKLEINK